MHDIRWSESEKKVSRRVFAAALERELAEIMADFKAKAERLDAVEDMWALQGYLREKQRGIEARYDYRYSRLIIVFGTLLRQKRIQECELLGLSEEKLALIRSVAGL